MGWVFQSAVNVGIQLVGMVALGWLFARLQWVQPSAFLPQINVAVMQVAFPAFTLYLLGLKVDLQDPEAWRSLGAFMLWATIIEVGIIIYMRWFAHGDVGEAGMLNMHLTMNQYGIMGLMVLQATFGYPLSSLALVVGVNFFVQTFPFTLVTLEWSRWIVDKHGGDIEQPPGHILASQQQSQALSKLSIPADTNLGRGSQRESIPGMKHRHAAHAHGATSATTSILHHDENSSPTDPKSVKGGSRAYSHKYRYCYFLYDDEDNGVQNPLLPIQESPSEEELDQSHPDKPLGPPSYPEHRPTICPSTQPSLNTIATRLITTKSGSLPVCFFGDFGFLGEPMFPLERYGSAADKSVSQLTTYDHHSLGRHSGVAHISRLPSAQPSIDHLSFPVSTRNTVNGSFTSWSPQQLQTPATDAAAAPANPPKKPAASTSPFAQCQNAIQEAADKTSSLDQHARSAQRTTSVELAAHTTQRTHSTHEQHVYMGHVSPASIASRHNSMPPDHMSFPSSNAVIPTPSFNYQHQVESSMYDRQYVREATTLAMQTYGGTYGCFVAFLKSNPQLSHILWLLGKNPLLWSTFVALLISASGLRRYLDPAAAEYFLPTGFIAGMLQWLTNLVVPMSLFSNGAWIYGKSMVPKNKLRLVVLMALKLVLLPLLMVGCAMVVGLSGNVAMVLVLLTLTPLAAIAFVLAVQYNRGAEEVTVVFLLGTVLYVPVCMAWMAVIKGLQWFEFTLKPPH